MKNGPLFCNYRINLLILIDITIIVYLSVLVSDFSSLDDTGLMENLQKGGISFTTITAASGSTYLRPLTTLSYLFDYHIWGANPGAFHLTNLVIHLVNACLVYHLCRNCLPDTANKEGNSLLSALLFAISPINSESVLWVSGRTDILCGLFFLGTLVILTSERSKPLSSSLLIFVFYSCSLLAKESSIAILGIVPGYLLVTRHKRSLLAAISLCSAVVIGSGIYMYLRLGPRGEIDSGTSKIITGIADQSIPEIAFKNLAAVGFYFKKMIWPLPLNLAIQEVNEPLYFFLGITSITLVFTSIYRFPSTRLPLLIILFCLAPPLLAFNGSIPWTLYAERYLYLAMTGVALLTGLLLTSSRMPQSLPFILIIPLALSTIHRSGQWADPVTLWHDTVKRSPHFPEARVVYTYELIQAGRLVEAEESINVVRRMRFENELLRKCIDTINSKKKQQLIAAAKDI